MKLGEASITHSLSAISYDRTLFISPDPSVNTPDVNMLSYGEHQ